MSRRTSIVNALVEKLKDINGEPDFTTNLYSNVEGKLKFWDEVNQFPAVYVTAGTETREYHPAEFAWGFLNVCLKVYVKGDDCLEQLEALLDDCEKCIDANRRVVYDTVKNYETTEILVQSIITDEGLLAPFGVGEINLQVRYQVM